ncbi:ataxin-7-like protein 2 [Xyrauchen texanus]|uniref:ataxin-7-like protein 2 n=1 Tax=Xyrauchen texanus TaxID=154827 RepID=UPI002242B62A|nr:ataxin-7-like protein 2 [Xyrauchen texanus]
MVADHARAKTVLASLDRRISTLDFDGQSWTTWIDKSDVSIPEGCSLEECSKNVKNRMETMTLQKEDMSIYGHCPAYDDFFLVVCSHCGQVVKPQAFEKHFERRHGPSSKLCGTPSNCSPDQPQQGRPPSQHGSLSEVQVSRSQGPGPPKVPLLHSPHQGCSKPLLEVPSLQQVDTVSQRTPPSPHVSTPSPRDLPWNRGKTSPKAPPPAEKPLQKSLDSHTPLHGPRNYSRTYKKVLKKECDLDKHCGVMDSERKNACTRLLTCNIHSIHQRRQVVGRSKPFDQLVMELKMSSKSRERPPLPIEVYDGGPSQPTHRGSQIGPLHHTHQITNYSILRSMSPSGSGVEMNEGKMHSEKTQVESVSACLSSEESGGENHEEFAHLPASTWHPKPLGFCTFGARVLGRSVLAFDQRLLHLRSAFSDMMEQHHSTYLWKKIPRASELCSPQPSVITKSYNSHDATRSSVPTRRASSLRTSTSGQSELPTKAQSTSGPGRPSNAGGRPSKQALQTRFRELQEGPTTSKRQKTPQDDEDSHGPGKMSYTPHHRDRQSSFARTTLRSPHGPFNGGLRAVAYEQKGHGRKRKTSGASSPKNTSCAPKPNILSSFSQTHSSPVSWGGDGRPGSTQILPKKLGAQKPKLLH